MLISLLTLLRRALNKQLGFNCNFFYSDENWLQVSGAGENLPPRCYFSVLQTAELYPCSPLLSCLSPTSDPPFREKYFGLSPDFSFQNVFQKVCQLPRGSQESQRGEKWRRQLSILAILSTLEISVTWIILAALVNIGHTNLWPNCSTHFDLPNQQILGRFLID